MVPCDRKPTKENKIAFVIVVCSILCLKFIGPKILRNQLQSPIHPVDSDLSWLPLLLIVLDMAMLENALAMIQ